MKIIKKTTYKVRVEEVIEFGRSVTTEQQEIESIVVDIDVDERMQKYELAEHLKKAGFHQSDGIFGTQRDFGTWMQGDRNWVQLQFKNERRFKRLYECALSWVKSKEAVTA